MQAHVTITVNGEHLRRLVAAATACVEAFVTFVSVVKATPGYVEVAPPANVGE